MPDKVLLEKTYTNIASDYSETVSLINAANSWFFIKNIPKNKDKMLDIGCGAGDLLFNLSKYFKESFGIDPVSAFVAISKSKNQKATILKYSAEKLPFPNNYFDYVVSNLVFQHTDREKALNEVIRVLKPGGKLVLTEVIKQPEELLLKLYSVFYRNLWTFPYLFLNIGLDKTLNAKKFLQSPSWKNLTNIHAPRRFTLNEFKSFYNKQLPGARFRYVDLRIESVVWVKN